MATHPPSSSCPSNLPSLFKPAPQTTDALSSPQRVSIPQAQTFQNMPHWRHVIERETLWRHLRTGVDAINLPPINPNVPRDRLGKPSPSYNITIWILSSPAESESSQPHVQRTKGLVGIRGAVQRMKSWKPNCRNGSLYPHIAWGRNIGR